MEQYPSIDKTIRDTYIYAYDKLDGSNMRVEWNPKTGFNKYGSRSQLIDETHPFLSEAIPLFKQTYAEELDQIFHKERYQRTTVFYEFYGPNSFAGFHEKEEEHQVTLFDVHVYKKGYLPPQEFNKLFKHVPTAELLYQGKPTQQFITEVKTSQLEGMTFEGVVCKGGYDNKRRLVSFKVKTYEWLEKLKSRYGENTTMFNKLV